jgi:hypothetical protein
MDYESGLLYSWGRRRLGGSPSRIATILANNHASSSPLVDSEIAGIRILEPAGRRRSQGRAMRKYKKYAAFGETLPGGGWLSLRKIMQHGRRARKILDTHSRNTYIYSRY